MSYDEFTEWERAAVRWLGGAGADAVAPLEWREAVRRFEMARSAVPSPHAWAGVPDGAERAWAALVTPYWPGFARVVGRYLAAKLFASWAAYLGDGLPAVLRGVEQARAVLQVECARHCARAGRGLDAALLTQAIRQSDLLLVHYADPARLFEAAPAREAASP